MCSYVLCIKLHHFTAIFFLSDLNNIRDSLKKKCPLWHKRAIYTKTVWMKCRFKVACTSGPISEKKNYEALLYIFFSK